MNEVISEKLANFRDPVDGMLMSDIRLIPVGEGFGARGHSGKANFAHRGRIRPQGVRIRNSDRDDGCESPPRRGWGDGSRRGPVEQQRLVPQVGDGYGVFVDVRGTLAYLNVSSDVQCP